MVETRHKAFQTISFKYHLQVVQRAQGLSGQAYYHSVIPFFSFHFISLRPI